MVHCDVAYFTPSRAAADPEHSQIVPVEVGVTLRSYMRRKQTDTTTTAAATTTMTMVTMTARISTREAGRGGSV
jgi:hypothetical protein